MRQSRKHGVDKKRHLGKQKGVDAVQAELMELFLDLIQEGNLGLHLLLDSTPQLIVYVIDKDSKAVKGSDTREDLNSVEDIVGICMNIPGGKRGTDYTATVSIHMQNNPFDDEGDLEGTNEN